MVEDRPLEPFMLPSRIERLLQAAARRIRSLTVVLDGVHDVHNLSAVVRSCEGFGLLDLHVVETHANFRVSPKVSQGAEKWLDIHRHRHVQSCIKALRRRGFDLWVADPRPSSLEVEALPWDGQLERYFPLQ